MKYKKSKVLFIISVALLVLFKVYYSIQVGSYGSTLSDIKNQTEEVKNENTEIEIEIKNSNSLTKISSKASELGFVDSDDIIYIAPDKPIAGLQ